ncbi:hypothetical protein CKO51_28030 [Rhodopirellula sp. SM50]|nr:hypothetical protein CKO51_28030 [Rhodopirellula sp. SM50]
MVMASCVLVASAVSQNVRAEGEPAEAFVKQLRNAGYFDTAISYLDRAEKMPGVDSSFVAAIPLERAQTYIETALNSGNPDDRDKAFADAEASLQEFLTRESHPRQSEARLQLGKLQMIRAAQLLAGEPVETEKRQARESYLAAAKTFDGIVSDLRGKLESMRGQKIDPEKDPDAAALRDQYRFEFLQSQLNAADAIKLAAKTHTDPAKDGKAQLEDAVKRFEELNQKYATYSPGAIALSHLGDLNELLGKSDLALDNYLRMLEEPAVDQLREAKFMSAAGVIRLKLAADPPAYQEAIDRTANWVKEIRPNEESLPVVQEFRIQLAKAYLAKAADDSLKKGEIGRAKSEGRDLLRAASKVPGPHVEQAKAMLADLGIEQETEALPTAEPPSSFDDAMEKATQVLSVTSDLEEALKVIQAQKQTPQLKQQIDDIQKQIDESYRIGVQVLRGGLAMVTSETNTESLNQARQILAYFLYQSKRLRETVVVGNFLARHAPGTDLGLKGGLMALTSMQLLLAEVPDDANEGLILQLESLGKFLAKTWPDDPNAAAAQGLQIRLLLKKDDFDGAQQLIDDMAAGSERASFKRLLGQLLWNQSIVARSQENDDAKSEMLIDRAKRNLQSGLDEIEGNLIEVEGMQAATVLAKIHLMQQDSAAALKVLDHPKYGPLEWITKLGKQSEAFAGELYSTELKALVGQMLESDTPETYLDRMTATMEKLRKAYQGEESQTRLTQTYMRLANDLKAQLDTATPARKTKLIEAFRVMLQRISDATNDNATLRWVGQTLMSMGEASMDQGQVKATGQAADLLAQAVETFKSLPDQDNPTTAYLLGLSQRLMGEYKDSIDTFDKLLQQKPLMLEAQVEAAQAYESWAGTLPPNIAYKAYRAALEGARPGKDKKNVIWGWAEISSKTSKMINRNENFKEKFFESRYHVALCLYLMGKAGKRDDDIKKAIKVIREAATLFPDLGGPKRRAEYDALMKEAQRSVGQNPVGIAKPQPNGN